MLLNVEFNWTDPGQKLLDEPGDDQPEDGGSTNARAMPALAFACPSSSRAYDPTVIEFPMLLNSVFS
jgi:hypothetical protein